MKKLLLITLTLALLFTAFPALAAPNAEEGKVKPTTLPCPEVGLGVPCIRTETQSSGASIRNYVVNTFGSSFIRGFLGIVAVTSVIFIIVAGIQMRMSFGNDEAIGTAKKTLIYAIFGLVISILSVAIVQIVSKLPFK